jgi:hypothetical protein
MLTEVVGLDALEKGEQRLRSRELAELVRATGGPLAIIVVSDQGPDRGEDLGDAAGFGVIDPEAPLALSFVMMNGSFVLV